MKEREISLVDLLVEILSGWRKVAIWMLAGAVLAGAFSYAQSYRAIAAQNAVAGLLEERLEMGQEEYRKDFGEVLSDSQMRKVDYVHAYKGLYRDNLDYQQSSVQMRIDPNSVQRAELTFYIISDSPRESVAIEKAYEDIVLSGEMGSYAKAQMGGNYGSITGCISVSRGSDGLTEGSDTFQVCVNHYDKEACQGIARAVAEFVRKKHASLQETMGRHQISVVNQSFAVVADQEIAEIQKSILNDNASMETVIAQYQDAFTAEERQYYDFLSQIEQNASDVAREDGLLESAKDEAAVARVSMKYVIFGTVLAAFAYLSAFFLRYIMNTKIRATDNLQELYGISQLGSIPKPEGKRKLFGFADRWIASLRDHGRRRFTVEEAQQLAATAVKMAAAKEGFRTICLIGCGLKGQALETCEAMKNHLEKENIQAGILDNVLYDAQAMGRLEGTGGVVLVERAQSTLYSEIQQELELMERQGIAVLGGIVVE